MIPLYVLLDVWMSIGGNPAEFDRWMADPKRTRTDAWAQLLGAIRGDLMVGDTNPPPGDALLSLIWQREVGNE